MAIIVPEIFADAVNSALPVSLRVGRVATDFTEMVPEITSIGDTVHFPTFNRIGAAEEMTTGKDLTPDRVNMTDSTATVKQCGKAVTVYDSEALSIKGAVLDNMATQIAEVMAEIVEKDLIAEMDTNAVYKSPVAAADKITSDEIQEGMKLFKDKRDSSSFAGILINSRLVPSFMSMPEFVDSTKTFQQNGNGVIEDGVLGFYYQIPVIVTDVNTYDDTASECKTYIVKKNALGKIVKRDINVEEQRQILGKKTDIAADTLYAVKLIDSKGVVICRKTVS